MEYVLCRAVLSHLWLFVTPWAVALQAPLSMEFSRQEYWSGLPFPPPGDLPNPGIKPGCPALQVVSLQSEPPGKPEEMCSDHLFSIKCYAVHISLHILFDKIPTTLML